MLAGLAAVLASGLAMLPGAPVAAQEPTPTGGAAGGPPIGPVTPGTVLCTVDNSELDEITGIVASGQALYAVEGGSTERPFVVEIWTIDQTTCAATSETYGFAPLDPQDLALASDGALWVADIGRGLDGRDWVTMERVDLAAGADAVPYRTLNPATGEITGTAVLLDTDNQPIIIANSGDTAVLYRPDGPMPADSTSNLPTLVPVGEFRPINTDTPTPRGAFGRLQITGAAISPDRTKVVLRTESDAYEFSVTNGDIVAAITQGTPTITPLPDEENGQAITYSADGTRFLTISAVPDPVLRAYQPYVPSTAPTGDAGAPSGGGGGGLNFSDITNIALAAMFLGLAAVVTGIVGIVRARREYERTGGGAGRGSRGRGDSRRREPGRRRDHDDPAYAEDDYDRDYDRDRDRGYDRDYDRDDYDYDQGRRPARPPRPRDDDAPGWADDGAPARPGRASVRVGPTGPGPGGMAGPPPGADDYSAGTAPRTGSTYGSSGTTYGTGGTTYGSGGATYGSGGTTYGSSGSGGATYGSSSRAPGPSGRSAPGGRPPGPAGGGVYGRPRTPDADDEDPRHPYGRDNIDL